MEFVKHTHNRFDSLDEGLNNKLVSLTYFKISITAEIRLQAERDHSWRQERK